MKNTSKVTDFYISSVYFRGIISKMDVLFFVQFLKFTHL